MKSFKLFGTAFELESIREEKFNDIKKNIIECTTTKKFISKDYIYVLYIDNRFNDRIFSMSFNGLYFNFNNNKSKIFIDIAHTQNSTVSSFSNYCNNILKIRCVNSRDYYNDRHANIFDKLVKNNITILDIGLDFNKFEEKIKTTSLFM